MRISELAKRARVSIKAVRYYERLGLIEAEREPNGYRTFNDDHVRAVVEIRELSEIGISPLKAGPFVECLDLGHDHGDECVSSLAVYRDSIAEVDRMIDALSTRRAALQQRLEKSAGRSFTQLNAVLEFTTLPPGLPVPVDDGAVDHLAGSLVPQLKLPSTQGQIVELSALGPGRTVLYLYPLTGRPGVDLPEGWDSIPGARGCSTEACNFRDHFQQLRDTGAERVFGLSSQSTAYQAEVVERLRLPFGMISDEKMVLADSLRLPTFAASGHERLYSRLTLIIRDGQIEHVFYPIFPPNTHALQVLQWLSDNPL
ncbi:redoxin family protein [Glutamicibacter sp. JL.03c]|uniref:MerR family DNA-binding transcriptional regulator n=1 Tax=Glutamicibacter sp. JL.03c TaxID=2984842 RepID=UPI0021F7F0ED|nr:MerR family DNA-binding transcriptional regulator [Glutamicibacter sp. JL.03c]UYQ77276.1 redoxin family protein [Glutamicibacter sp. JL.03c]